MAAPKRRRQAPKHSRKSLDPRQHEVFLNSILENIPDMIFVKDAKDLRFVRFNKAGLKLLGVTTREVIGKNDYDFFPKDEADFFTQKDRDVLARGKLVEIAEEPIHTRRGVRILHTKKIPILNEAGEPQYLLGISEDITDRRQAAEALQQANTTLMAKNQELESFTYSVSHDLRAPLRAIEGFAQILLEEAAAHLNDEDRRLLNIIRANTLQMSQLIDDLLAFARIGSKSIGKSRVPMDDLAKSVVADQQKLDDRPATIKFHPLEDAYGDKALLRQVLVNLISNAFKFTRLSPAACIEIGSKKTDREIIYHVHDNGVGFDMRYADKLFGVFERLHTSDRFEGTGVGLAIVQRIIQKHGGRVWAEGRVHAGAKFYFSLPLPAAGEG